MLQIGVRYSQYTDSWSLEDLRQGMTIAGKVDGDLNFLSNNLGYFPNFSYVVHEIRSNGVYTRDLGHHNWIWIDSKELHDYELVMSWHPCSGDGNSSDTNEALLHVQGD